MTQISANDPLDRPRSLRATFGFAMLLGTVVAVGLSVALAKGLGADGATIKIVLIALGVGSVATLVPIVLNFGRETWGVAVMFAGAARMLLALGVCYFAKENNPELLARPLFLGVGSAALMLMVVEVWTSIRILSAMERGQVPASPTAGETQRKAA